MSTKPLLSGSILFEIEPKRYDELVKKEARLEMLEKALCAPNAYVSDIKKLFSLEGAAE